MIVNMNVQWLVYVNKFVKKAEHLKKKADS